jgi:hypothetical protein
LPSTTTVDLRRGFILQWMVAAWLVPRAGASRSLPELSHRWFPAGSIVLGHPALQFLCSALPHLFTSGSTFVSPRLLLTVNVVVAAHRSHRQGPIDSFLSVVNEVLLHH